MLAHLASLLRRLLGAVEVAAAAGRAGAAAEEGLAPATPDLVRLGIDPARFALSRRPAPRPRLAARPPKPLAPTLALG